ncbi:hypothetical protein FQN51_004352 [Onygenales sp. PD_10]|nr:hypothetical protein FQN51_004352 [Onygenales sp. PD_10]
MSGFQQCVSSWAATCLASRGAWTASRSRTWTGLGTIASRTLLCKRNLSIGKGADGVAGSGASSVNHPPSSVTWFTPDPAQVKPADIISQLPILPYKPDLSRNVPVLLVTPAFAPWIGHQSSFLQSSMTRIFQNRKPSTATSAGDNAYYAVVAVVDKLSTLDSNKKPQDTIFQQEVWDHGSEGISLLIVSKDMLAGQVPKSTQTRDMSTPEVEPIFCYQFQGPMESSRSISSEMGIRIANTLFVNGKPRTMFASCWNDDSGSATLTMDKAYDLIGCQISGSEKPHNITAQIPLEPITKPREIVTSMGNIISQLSKGDGSAATIPASAELEKLIPEYIKENNISSQKLAVWALIRPQIPDGEVPASLTSALLDANIPTHERARLHRVVSGGGGWGKKQGLLSLDPEYSYQTSDPSAQLRPVHEIFKEKTLADPEGESETIQDIFDELPGSMQFKDGRFTTSLSEIARKGDTVEFLVAPLDPPHPSPSSTGDLSSLNTPTTSSDQPLNNRHTFSFGVIPSSSDGAAPEQYLEAGNNISSSTVNRGGNIITVPNLFGALSEKGLVYSEFCEGGATTSENDGGRRQITWTKIDVPGSRVVIET